MIEGRSEFGMIAKDWQIVGNYARRAVLDISAEKGGAELIEQIKPLLTDKTSPLPTKAVAFLVERYPEVKESFMDRVEVIQQRKHQEDKMRLLAGKRPRSSETLLEEPQIDGDQRIKDLFRRRKNR